jgi:hypothetical protein
VDTGVGHLHFANRLQPFISQSKKEVAQGM